MYIFTQPAAAERGVSWTSK